MRTIYVDNNATTQVDPAVVEVMLPFLKEQYGNPSSMHTFGGHIYKNIDTARLQVASLIGAESPKEIIFTSCGTESDNAAIFSALTVNPQKKHIVSTVVEHPAVKNVIEFYETKGYRITRLGVDRKGCLDMDEVQEAITNDTALVSIMYANNETGVIFPIEEIGAICKKKGVLFHTDAVQAVGKIPLNMRESTIDMLSLSGHKIHGPKGVGALYVREGIPFRPFMIGGHQERNRRGGTENVAGIVALGKACEIAIQYMEDENTRVKAMRNRLEEALLKSIPESMCNGIREERLPNTANISFQYIEGEAILLMMDKYGICASSGSACTSGSLEPSHVLRAMGIPYTAAHGSVRFSLSRFNSDEDIDAIIAHMPEIITTLRKISPFNKETL